MKIGFSFALFCATLVGCFPALEQDPNFPTYFTRKLPTATAQARLDGDRLFGADVDIRKGDATYRGTSNIGIIDLRVTEAGTRIEGTLGTSRTELYVQDVGAGMTGKGLISGAVSHFDLTPTSLTGKIGSCEYDLRQNAESHPYFVGLSRCGAGRGTRGGGTHVALPARFGELPLDARAVFIAVFLGH